MVGEMAQYIGTLPEAARATAWDQQVSRLAQRHPELQGYVGQYSPENLQAAIAEAGAFGEFYSRSQPDYMAIPEGGTLVNTRDPQAIQQFGGSAPQNQQSAQRPARQAPLFQSQEWGAYARAMGDVLPTIVERDKPVIVNNRGEQVQTDVINGQIGYLVNGVWYDNPEGN
jgi:hypothetical protein